jgi:hypothetical protein
MTVPLYYTVALPPKEAPFALGVYREQRHILGGTRETGKPGVASMPRKVCIGQYKTFEQAERATTMAAAVFEKHQAAVNRATFALGNATSRRDRELRQRLKKIGGHRAA